MKRDRKERYEQPEQVCTILYSSMARCAIRAFVHLAQLPKNGFATNVDIARVEDLPAPYLSKILQHFARTGLLRSVKGPKGGFALEIDSDQIRLLDIVAPLDGLVKYRRCITGLSKCSDDVPCSMHEGWVPIRAAIMDYLERTTIEDLRQALEDKRRAIDAAARAKKSRVKRHEISV